MDVETSIARMEELLAEARPMPLSASVMVNRQDFDDLIADLREALPDEIRQARWVLKERDEVLAQARREAAQLLDDAEAERARLIGETEIMRAAQRESERILDEARDRARVLRLEAEDYVDAKLASFETVLGKTLTQVEKGRERLRGRMAHEVLTPQDQAPDEGALDADPELGSQLYDHEQL